MLPFHLQTWSQTYKTNFKTKLKNIYLLQSKSFNRKHYLLLTAPGEPDLERGEPDLDLGEPDLDLLRAFFTADPESDLGEPDLDIGDPDLLRAFFTADPESDLGEPDLDIGDPDLLRAFFTGDCESDLGEPDLDLGDPDLDLLRAFFKGDCDSDLGEPDLDRLRALTAAGDREPDLDLLPDFDRVDPAAEPDRLPDLDRLRALTAAGDREPDLDLLPDFDLADPAADREAADPDLRKIEKLSSSISYTAQRCVCQFPFLWIYFYSSNKSTGKETGKTHLCVLVCSETKSKHRKYSSRMEILLFRNIFNLFLRLVLGKEPFCHSQTA